MAWLEQDPSGNFHIAFRYLGARYRRSLRTKSEGQAEARRLRLEETISLVESGRLDSPPGGDVGTFLLSDGKLNGRPKSPKRLSLEELFTAYLDSLPIGALEPETLRVAGIHLGHFRRILGSSKKADSITTSRLQLYIDKRARQPGKHGRRVSAATIKKELATLRAIWNWARTEGYLKADFPSGLHLTKEDAKQPFRTRTEIERQLSRGEFSRSEEAGLWAGLYLALSETDEVLRVIEAEAAYSFLHPMVVMAAHTGARRSELCRSEESDFDFEAGVVTIREKKRVKGRRTIRQVPISPRLQEVMTDWFAAKRGSRHTFPAEHKVSRVRKKREIVGAVSPDEASDQLETTLAGTEWEKIRGWHVFRHSFASNCAAAGIDQRLMDGTKPCQASNP